MAEKTHYDLVVIGGGPGGYVAAIRASQLGLKVAVVERENLGGICLNWGCIPTKALLRAAEIYHLAASADQFGISIGKLGFDLKKLIKRSRDVAATLSAGISHLMKKNKIAVFMASGKLAGKSGEDWRVELDKGDALTARAVILATGARAKHLPNIAPDGKQIVTYRDAMTPKTLPKSLLIIGSGAIGMEFASFYHDIGVEVSVVEAAPRILPVEDADISTMAAEAFSARGINLHTDAKLETLTAEKGKVKAQITEKGKTQSLTAERAILAVGIEANVEGLGLEESGIKLERGHVITDTHAQTNIKGIYAIGDMAGAPWLAHKAAHEGIIAAEHIAGNHPDGGGAHGMKPQDVPSCTYCRPQIASVGLTEAAARAGGRKIRVGKFPFLANGKALAQGESSGMIKTIFDAKTGELLGAHMIGAEVTELIHGYVIARQCEATEAELMASIFPHPTLSEAMHESVLDAFDRGIHF